MASTFVINFDLLYFTSSKTVFNSYNIAFAFRNQILSQAPHTALDNYVRAPHCEPINYVQGIYYKRNAIYSIVALIGFNGQLSLTD